MMRNADKLSMEEIVTRQKIIGGIDLFDITPKDPNWKNEVISKKQWVLVLARFHRYAKENKKANFKISWKEWSDDHAEYLPNIDHLVFIKS